MHSAPRLRTPRHRIRSFDQAKVLAWSRRTHRSHRPRAQDKSRCCTPSNRTHWRSPHTPGLRSCHHRRRRAHQEYNQSNPYSLQFRRLLNTSLLDNRNIPGQLSDHPRTSAASPRGTREIGYMPKRWPPWRNCPNKPSTDGPGSESRRRPRIDLHRNRSRPHRKTCWTSS